MSSNGYHATPASEYRRAREEGVVVQLPSSLFYMRIRPVDLSVLIASGKIPDPLTPLAAQTLWEGKTLTLEEMKDLTTKSQVARDFSAMMATVIKAAAMDPEISDNPTANAISLADLDLSDRIFLYELAVQPLGVLHRFRAGQTQDVGALPDSESDVQPT